MPVALGIVQLVFRECLRATRRVRGMSALNYRPVYLSKHPIGVRSDILRASRKGEKGDNSEFLESSVVLETFLETLFTPLAAEAPTCQYIFHFGNSEKRIIH